MNNTTLRTHIIGILKCLICCLFFCFAACPTGVFADDKPADENTYSRELTHDGRTRSYLIHAPAGIENAEQIPLVIVLHGGGGNAIHAMKNTGFNEKADSEGFIVVYPNGSGYMNNAMLTWNAVKCCKYSMENNIDDAGFVEAIIDEVSGKYSIDQSRIYAAGFSNGGMLAHHLGCRLSHRLAAIAPVAGCVTTPDCEPEQPINVIMFHGTNDLNVPYEGGVGPRALVKLKKKPVKYAVALWKNKNKCEDKPATQIDGDIQVDSYACPETGTDVVLYTITGGTHSWPGGERVYIVEDKPNKDISATDIMWDFFSSHPKHIKSDQNNE